MSLAVNDSGKDSHPLADHVTLFKMYKQKNFTSLMREKQLQAQDGPEVPENAARRA